MTDCQRGCCSVIWMALQLKSEVKLKSNGRIMLVRPASCRAFTKSVEEMPGQGSLEGCHRMFTATHLIYGLESV